MLDQKIINEYAKKLETQKDSELSHADKIRVNLLNELRTLSEEASAQEKQLIFDLSKKIMLGKIPSSTQFNEDQKAAAQNKIAPTIAAALDSTHQVYQSYYRDLYESFNDILTNYSDYIANNKFTLRNKIGYLFKGHFYKGDHQKSYSQDFIELIHCLTLIDGGYIAHLKAHFFSEDKKVNSEDKVPDFTLNYQKQSALIDKMYDIFKDVKDRYKATATEKGTHYQKKLTRHYLALTSTLPRNEIGALYKTVVEENTETADTFASRITAAETIAIQQHRSALANEAKINSNEIKNDTRRTWHKLYYDLCKIREEKEAADQLTQQQLKKLKQHIQRFAQQLGLPSRIIKHNGKYTVLDPGDAREKNLVDPEKQENRKTKRQNKWWAIGAALLVGFGEALVAVTGITAVLPGIPFLAALFVVGITGWICNYFLFKDDTKNMLSKFRLIRKIKNEKGEVESVTRLFIDEMGNKVTRKKKIAIIAFGALSIATGFVLAALSFFSVQDVILNLIPSLAGVAGSALPAILAALPAIGTFLGMTCIFFTTIADFITNERWIGIGRYFENTYTAPWKGMSGWEKFRHLTLRCPFEILKLTIGIAINFVLTIATFGMFYKNSLDLLGRIFNVTASTTAVIEANTIIAVTATGISGPFSADKTIGPINSLGKQITFASLDYEKEDKPAPTVILNPVQQFVRVIEKITRFFSYLFALINGASYGSMLSNQIGALGQSNYQSLLSTPVADFGATNLGMVSSGVAQGVASVIPNGLAMQASQDNQKILAATTDSKLLATSSISTEAKQNSNTPVSQTRATVNEPSSPDSSFSTSSTVTSYQTQSDNETNSDRESNGVSELALPPNAVDAVALPSVTSASIFSTKKENDSKYNYCRIFTAAEEVKISAPWTQLQM